MRAAGSRSPGVRSWFSGGRATTRVAPTRHIPAPRAGWTRPLFLGARPSWPLAGWKPALLERPPAVRAPPHPSGEFLIPSLEGKRKRVQPLCGCWRTRFLFAGRRPGWVSCRRSFFSQQGIFLHFPHKTTRVNRPGVWYGVSSFRFFPYETPLSSPSYRPEQPAGSTPPGPHKPFPERTAS